MKQVKKLEKNKYVLIGPLLSICAVWRCWKTNESQQCYRNFCQIEHVHRNVNNGIKEMLRSVIEFESGETGKHSRNVRDIMRILLEAANCTVENQYFSEEEINIIASAAVLHDIGKIAIPDAILNKPEKLTEKEFEIVKTHPEAGCRMIETMKDMQGTKYFKYSYEICKYHHEAYDGSGYPEGISGDDIPFVSQLASLADVYEALRSKRVYKDSYDVDEVYRIITTECKGKFSDDVMKCYRYARNEMDAMMIGLSITA